MKLEIDVPDLKYKAHDFILITYCDSHIIAKVLHVECNYTVIVRDGKLYIITNDIGVTIIVQEASYSLIKTNIRPGTVMYFSYSELANKCEIIEYAGKVWDADTPANVKQRIEEWENRKSD